VVETYHHGRAVWPRLYNPEVNVVKLVKIFKIFMTQTNKVMFLSGIS
jgi:hypothetical protein